MAGKLLQPSDAPGSGLQIKTGCNTRVKQMTVSYLGTYGGRVEVLGNLPLYFHPKLYCCKDKVML